MKTVSLTMSALPKKRGARKAARPKAGRSRRPAKPDSLHSLFANLVEGRLAATGMSVTQLAQKAGVASSHVYKVVKALESEPTISAIRKLSHALGLQPWQMLMPKDTSAELEKLGIKVRGDGSLCKVPLRPRK